MTLPCDSSRSVFPDNKVGKFTTMLAREVVLDGKYEVGLSELVMPVAQRPTKFHQVIAYTEADLLFKAWTVDMRKVTFAEDIHSLDVPLGVDKKPVFRFSVKNKKATLIVSPGCTVYIEEKSALELACVFGFLVGIYSGGELGKSYEAAFPFNSREKLFFVYVYCDLVEYSFVGDSMVPCLRALPIIPGEERVNVLRFENPHYMPVSQTRFSTVTIEIADGSGDDLQFAKGLPMVKLHFRPKKI
jgi:hypothetical protein